MKILTLLLLGSFSSWYYLGQTKTQKGVEIFAPNDVSTMHNERDMAVSPDGKTICYSLVGVSTAAIVVRKYQNNRWSAPEIAPFSGQYYDIEPFFSPDGKRLYFATNRPTPTLPSKNDFDIWFVEIQANSQWSAPQNAGNVVNTPANEFYPAVTTDGTLYYTARYKTGGKGGEDIWMSKIENGQFQSPSSVSEAVNSDKDEFNAYVSPDGKRLIFSSYGRKDDLGGGDLYMAQKDDNGQWQPAVHLKNDINSPKLDYCPFVSPDGKYLFFTSERKKANATKPIDYKTFVQDLTSTSNGKGDIYWVEIEEVLKK
jgi:Tol biopolymer transport system component